MTRRRALSVAARALTACVLALAALLATRPGVAAAPARSSAEVRRAVERAVSGGTQRRLPGDWEPRAGAPAASERARPRPERRPRPPLAASQGAASTVARVALWALMIVAGLIGLTWLARELGGYAGDPAVAERDDPLDEGAARRAVVERPLGDADELARRGDFGEAIHALLLRTLGELSRRVPGALPRSLTSREILGRVDVPDDARVALEGLVLAVEVSHFGGDDPGEADYQRCREHFARFATAYTRGRA